MKTKIEATFPELMEELASGKYGHCGVADQAQEFAEMYKKVDLKIIKETEK